MWLRNMVVAWLRCHAIFPRIPCGDTSFGLPNKRGRTIDGQPQVHTHAHATKHWQTHRLMQTAPVPATHGVSRGRHGTTRWRHKGRLLARRHAPFVDTGCDSHRLVDELVAPTTLAAALAAAPPTACESHVREPRVQATPTHRPHPPTVRAPLTKVSLRLQPTIGFPFTGARSGRRCPSPLLRLGKLQIYPQIWQQHSHGGLWVVRGVGCGVWGVWV
jgi:hypothetical protein